jgi:glycosyltransferase involved in cell wall biosynthesis
LAISIPRDADLIWSPHYNISLLNRSPLMVTVHDVFHLAMPQYVPRIHRRLYAKAMFSVLKTKARIVLCDSEFTKRELTRLTGIDSRKIRVIHLGVDQDWFGEEKADRPHPRPYVLSVGNVKPHKNLTALMSAMRRIVDKIPQDLVIVGKREGFITMDEEVAGHAELLGDRVTFTGRIEETLLKQYYIHADCLVFPSLYEGFGLPPVEAMACGCPALVSNAASLPEVCGDAALYFDPHSPDDLAAKLVMLIEDSALRDSLHSKGLARAKGFTWENTARDTLSALNTALSR